MLRKERKLNHISCSLKTAKGRKNVGNKNKNKEQKKKQRTITIDINPTTSIITLNVNGLNTPHKRQRLSEWIRKQDPNYMLSKRNPI